MLLSFTQRAKTLIQAGYTSFRVQNIPCAVWYPTSENATDIPQGVYTFHVAKNAEPEQGYFPLMIMSHGSGGTRFGHCKTAEFFAQNGFIVLAPEHPNNNFFDDSGVGSAKTYQERSAHMKVVLDAFLLDENWTKLVNPDKITVFGFSLGGYTALSCVGAHPSVEGLRNHIRLNREFDPIFSGYEVVVRDGYDEPDLPVTYDPRYKACIALAPVSGGFFPKDSLKNISIPIQIFRAERDMILRNPFHAQEIRDNLPIKCDYHVTEKAGHFSYLSPVDKDKKEALGELANDVAGFDREKEHQKIHHLMLDFLQKALS